MKFLVIGDLHGRKPIIKHKDFDAIVVVGDICDDRDIAPLYKKYFSLLKDEPKLDFDDFTNKKVGKVKMKAYEKKSLKRGNQILKQLDKIGKPIFMVAGNWDQSFGPTKIKNKGKYNNRKAMYDRFLGDEFNSLLIKGTKNIINCMFQNNEWNGINIVGYGLSSTPERKTKDKSLTEIQQKKLERAHNKLRDKLKNAHKKRENKSLPTLFITHNVPHNTKLDIIRDKKSYVYKKHFGSTIAREFCNKFQPLVCVGGHMHENPGKVKIKKTVAINAGYGGRAQVLIDIDEKNKRIRKIKF